MSAAPLYTFCSTISGRPFPFKSTTFKTAHYILVRGFPSENQSIIPKQNMPNAIKRHHFIYFLGWCVVSIPHFFCPPPMGRNPGPSPPSLRPKLVSIVLAKNQNCPSQWFCCLGVLHTGVNAMEPFRSGQTLYCKYTIFPKNMPKKKLYCSQVDICCCCPQPQVTGSQSGYTVCVPTLGSLGHT